MAFNEAHVLALWQSMVLIFSQLLRSINLLFCIVVRYETHIFALLKEKVVSYPITKNKTLDTLKTKWEKRIQQPIWGFKWTVSNELFFLVNLCRNTLIFDEPIQIKKLQKCFSESKSLTKSVTLVEQKVWDMLGTFDDKEKLNNANRAKNAVEECHNYLTTCWAVVRLRQK